MTVLYQHMQMKEAGKTSAGEAKKRGQKHCKRNNKVNTCILDFAVVVMHIPHFCKQSVLVTTTSNFISGQKWTKIELQIKFQFVYNSLPYLIYLPSSVEHTVLHPDSCKDYKRTLKRTLKRTRLLLIKVFQRI